MIRVDDSGDALGDNNPAALALGLAQLPQNLRGGLHIHTGQGVIQQQHFRVPHQRAGNGCALALAAREGRAPLAHNTVQPLGKLGHIFGEPGLIHRVEDAGIGHIGDAQSNVVAQGHTEKQGFLGHVDDRFAQVGQFDLPDVVAVDGNASFGGVVDAPQQTDEHRLARTRRPDNAECRARRDVQIDVA